MLFRFWFLDFQSLCLEVTVTGVGAFWWVYFGCGTVWALGWFCVLRLDWLLGFCRLFVLFIVGLLVGLGLSLFGA